MVHSDVPNVERQMALTNSVSSQILIKNYYFLNV